MKKSTVAFFIVFLVLLQLLEPVQVFPSFQPNKQFSGKKSLAKTESTSGNSYKLEAYPLKSEYTLNENIVIAIFLFNPVTLIQISDMVLITTPLGTISSQLSNFANIITIDKANCINGLNSISVSYKTQSVSFTILRQDPSTSGPTSTSIRINDLLNSRPAPGVPEYINYSITNPTYTSFPTQNNEYVQVSIKYYSFNLVLNTYFYQLDDFIINNQLNFRIPSFVQQQHIYNLTIYYSGDSVLESSNKIISIKIHNFTPIISGSISNTVIGTTNVFNDTDTFLRVKIEGYLPTNLVVTVKLSDLLKSYTIIILNITNYRQNIPIAVVTSINSGSYQLQANFTHPNAPIGTTLTFSVTVVTKIGLIIRTNSTIFTLGSPVLFDFFCYDPQTFNGIDCIITMIDNTTNIMTLIAPGGHVQKIITFNNIDTSYIHEYTFEVNPEQINNLYINDISFYAKFYHNTTISVNLPNNIIDNTQLVSFKADTNGKFTIFNADNLILNSFNYNQAGSYTNYYINFNNTYRGINTITVTFNPFQSNFANVTEKYQIFIYDKIQIQSVQTNGSFFQLGSWILLSGVATIGTSKDSLNGIFVSLLLNNVIIANTTIQTNDFTFIIKTPNNTGLMKYQIVIFANNTQFIITSDVYEVTVSIINNFGLNFAEHDYQVGNTIQFDIYGLQNRKYNFYYVLNSEEVILEEFIYNQTFNYNFTPEEFGHYTFFLEEASTKDQTYYAINVLQNPTVQVNYGLLKTYTNSSLIMEIGNYTGSAQIKIDDLFQNNQLYVINSSRTIQLFVYSTRAGNHSLTLLLNNNYTIEKVRLYYFIIYQKIELSQFNYTMNGSYIVEEDTIIAHMKFSDPNNQSVNNVPIQIITNDNTILAQANIFNSESVLQFTVLGTNLSLVINEVPDQFIHAQIIPLNLTVYKLLTSNIQDKYFFDSNSNLNLHFTYKYFPDSHPFMIQYKVVQDSNELTSNTTMGQNLTLKFSNNGNYKVIISVSCHQCLNRTFQTTISMKKIFDISNANLVTGLIILGIVPIILVTITIIKKKKSII